MGANVVNVSARQLHHRRGERGAILIHVAIAMVGLLALSAFTIDHGVMMVSRGQGQNSADAAALAAAAYLAWDDSGDPAGAQAVGVAAAQQNWVWGQPPDVTQADITFPACPPGAPGAPDTCVRADVFRNQRPNGNPLPVFFASLVGMADQGIKATATAQVVSSNSADCVKPFGIYDKWRENDGAGGWLEPDPLVDIFERYEDHQDPPVTLPEPDLYIDPWGQCPEAGPCTAEPPTGYDADSANPNNDIGTPIIIKASNTNSRIAPGIYHPVVTNPIEGPGANNYRDNIRYCDDFVHTIPPPGEPGYPYELFFEPGNMIGPTRQGIDDLMGLDTGASWFDPDGPGGDPGYPVSTCMEFGTCTDADGNFSGLSARWIALPLFDPDHYDAGRPSGRQTVEIVDIIGLWLEGFCSTLGVACPQGSSGNDVLGYITHYPSLAQGDLSGNLDESFLRTVILVR